MTIIERVRPRILIGEGQGGVVVAMSTFPVILERACRDRAVTDHQMSTFREAWSGVASILVIDPVVLPASNNLKRIPFEVLTDAFPNMSWDQPRQPESDVHVSAIHDSAFCRRIGRVDGMRS